jgi:glycosyltransferase involved in cell wall biosynthesis
MRELLPNATFVNQLSAEGCQWLPSNAVNSILNTARVGLCLSAVEGQMMASIEYLMAGLPIVSTPSVGGRDYFFDPEYCLIAPDDPRAIRDAVAALIERNIPRDHIRTKTMQRVERERARFIDWVQGVIDRNGGSENFADRFMRMLRTDGVLPWVTMRQFVPRVTGRNLTS